MADARERVAVGTPLETRGTLTRLTGLVLEAAGIRVPVGSQCMVQMPGHTPVLAEVVGFSADKAFLMPAGDIHGLSSGASVTPLAPYRTVDPADLTRLHARLVHDAADADLIDIARGPLVLQLLRLKRLVQDTTS